MRGFTIVEVLVVLIILSLMVVLAYPRVLHILRQTEETSYQEFVNTIELATAVYIEQNATVYNLKEPDDEVVITIADLINAGLYNRATINPKTKEPIDVYDQIYISVTESYLKEYIYPYTE